MRIIALLVLLIASLYSSAQKIYGTVFNDKGDLLPFASITVKGTSVGTSANNKARFSFSLPSGKYTLICQHIGYTSAEKVINVTGDTEISFLLSGQKLTLKEVVVKSGAEDPAYEIIRQAIKKRPYYYSQVNGFTCDLYSKDLVKLRNLPKKIFGQKIPTEDRKEMGLDSTGQGIIYLSEAISKIYSQRPDKFKMEVQSSRVSGSGGFGFTFPTFITLYTNNVTVFSERLNPRGFISPIADGALKFYRYKFLGTFWEDGKAVNAIQVTPRRTYEPLFSGIINIIDEEWRIHSFDLLLTKTSQLEILDTLQIRQLHVPVGNDIWRVKNQLLHFNFNQFKIDAIGNFLTVYSNYVVNPSFDKKFFDKVVIKYDTAVNKKTKAYWDTVRPVPLENEEQLNYKVKDSIYLSQKDSLLSKRDVDSLKKKQGSIKPYKIFWGGLDRTHYSKTNTYTWGIEPLLTNLEYNPAEGLVTNFNGYFEKPVKRSKINLGLYPTVRYGFNNTHFNAWMDVELRTRDWSRDKKIRRQTWTFSGGKRVSQFNKQNPISPLRNSISTLFYGNNFMKTYENYFGSIGFRKRYESGFQFSILALYEDRIPLNNTSNFTFRKKDSINITGNFPYKKNSADTVQFKPHQAVTASFSISFKPGQRYIQFPHNKISIGSKYPTFTLGYTKGIHDMFGSDVNFDKWNLSMHDDKNFKLAGTLKYKLSVGGFLNRKTVFIQDYQHFNGNQSRLAASPYVNSFQLAEYYANSTTARLYSLAHLEHHFNGLLTNKIPLFKRLNWNLVAGCNAFYVNSNNNYSELFIGLENIFKLFRVDFVAAYENGKNGLTGIKIGAGGLLGGSIRTSGSVSRRGNSINLSF